MQADPWLDPWLQMVRRHAAGAPVLEIGCGTGADTATLVAAGLQVVAFDRSATAVAAARLRVPAATVLVRDLREDFPAAVQGTGVVIASLSLHYFAWDETVRLFDQVRQALKPGGLFLCRLNSTEDIHFGAQGHPEIAPNYYLVDGVPKRFFDRACVEALLASGWQLQALAHKRTGKYLRPKALWELVCTKGDSPGS
ncbi:bifunctional 2-polyprenyl-6-hydroxyphenol methylase/3-demethylubiquinol 3-O-methyltransferase UbiG [Pseudorhodoferax sp. Leaf267]|uniref:class I SAM-dependent methyltransferase n=1 Tax=Pseudorhodoferax sp. Leaf267 TaxID=1736316 RepID=UPI0006F7EB01|nr:class I SAM-dependent methyltransferase [Pseudorhodoferax sp. Leaf267]KQP21809.1 methyltransferase [Pseudorhodoferax sp. Leaf267]